MSLSREFEAALKNHFLAMTALLDVELATVVSSPFESATKFLLFEYDSPMFSDEFAVSAWPMSEDGEPTAKGHWLLKGRAVVVPREIEDYPKYENINRWDLASKLLERWFVRRWKQLRICVSHFPPGTSKWNKIEHRLFCHITQNWRGKPLRTFETIVDLIANTTTKAGLRVKAKLDPRKYKIGRETTEAEMRALALRPNKFHGEWNYELVPRKVAK